VLQADRSLIAKREANEGTGIPETLWGKLNPKEFGSRALGSMEEEKLKRQQKKLDKMEKQRKGLDRQSKRE
jgi:pre-mRNA-splicing helicase BRR2